MEVIALYGPYLLIAGCIFGFFMAWGIGANDVANAMGPSVGAKALTLAQAILVACIFELAGAYLAGGEVTSTIRKGIIDPVLLADSPELLVFGMMASLLAAGVWLIIASFKGWPVSTTHSIVGAIVGFAAVGISVESVNWSKVGSIVSSWVISPIMAGVISYLIFKSVQNLILNTKHPFDNAKKYVPGYIFLVGFVISMVTLLKGLKHVGLTLNFQESLTYSILIGIGMALLGSLILRRVENTYEKRGDVVFDGVEKVFGVLMVFTACAMAFAHGSNDVANAVGPLAAIVSVIQSGGEIASKSTMPWWILLLGGVGIVSGLAMLGYRVIETVGRNITELTPSRGFAAMLAAAATIVLGSGTGLPLSTTHTLVGAVLGVGLARGISAIDLGVVGRIIVSWVVTLPVGAGLSILFFFTLKGIFS
ncbi:MAG TPA: inorganic phosphate transporter [Gammaproteobacteria bacterium]|jgi:PiT family inorganic phosphate transporter|nr:inorganic phosphate transporter [Gammaproteobacteria bacterium]HIK72865.1 inorganic phosphate transporter [Gammaproteobacteria bacterium]